jgi:hypothetical protein
MLNKDCLHAIYYVFACADNGFNLHILGICQHNILHLMIQNSSVVSLNKISSTNNCWYITCIVFLFTKQT